MQALQNTFVAQKANGVPYKACCCDSSMRPWPACHRSLETSCAVCETQHVSLKSQVVVLGFFEKYDAEDKKYTAFEAGAWNSASRLDGLPVGCCLW